jgi:hypothetical protein
VLRDIATDFLNNNFIIGRAPEPTAYNRKDGSNPQGEITISQHVLFHDEEEWEEGSEGNNITISNSNDENCNIIIDSGINDDKAKAGADITELPNFFPTVSIEIPSYIERYIFLYIVQDLSHQLSQWYSLLKNAQ